MPSTANQTESSNYSETSCEHDDVKLSTDNGITNHPINLSQKTTSLARIDTSEEGQEKQTLFTENVVKERTVSETTKDFDGLHEELGNDYSTDKETTVPEGSKNRNVHSRESMGELENHSKTVTQYSHKQASEHSFLTDQSDIPKQDVLDIRTLPNVHKHGSVRTLKPIKSQIRMEDIQWQRLLERKLNRETKERELEQRYREELKAQIYKIEKQKKTDSLMLKRRMIEVEKKRRNNNNAFCRMLIRKDKEYQAENEALYHRILEIDRQKQKNVEKLKARVNYLEERKKKEQESFLHRIQELERRREEEYEASQKRFQEIDRKKYNEQKTLFLQKIGVKKEVRSVQPPNEINEQDDTVSKRKQNATRDSKLFITKNITDQLRVMEFVHDSITPRNMLLPKLHPKRNLVSKHKEHKVRGTKETNTRIKEENVDVLHDDILDETPIKNTEKTVETKTDDFRLDLTVSN